MSVQRWEGFGVEFWTWGRRFETDIDSTWRWGSNRGVVQIGEGGGFRLSTEFGTGVGVRLRMGFGTGEWFRLRMGLRSD